MQTKNNSPLISFSTAPQNQRTFSQGKEIRESQTHNDVESVDEPLTMADLTVNQYFRGWAYVPSRQDRQGALSQPQNTINGQNSLLSRVRVFCYKFGLIVRRIGYRMGHSESR